MNRKEIEAMLSGDSTGAFHKEGLADIHVASDINDAVMVVKILKQCYINYGVACNALQFALEYIGEYATYDAMVALWTANQRFRTYHTLMLPILQRNDISGDFREQDQQMCDDYRKNRASILLMMEYLQSITDERIV